MTDIIDRLRALSLGAHDDLSIGDEAADEIARLRTIEAKANSYIIDNARLAEQVAALTADAGRYRWMTANRLGWFSRMAPLPWQKQTMKDALDAAIDAARKDQP